MCTPQSCAKCQGAMELGFVVDHDDVLKQMRWVRGAPQSSIWSGLSIDHDQMYKAVAYRCLKCGYLEFYAVEKP